MSSGKPLKSLTSPPIAPKLSSIIRTNTTTIYQRIPQASMSITAPLRQWSLPPAAVSDVGPRRSPGTALPESQPPTPEGSVVSVPDHFTILRKMWNDEDNNPYGAFDQHESHLPDSLHSDARSPRKLALPSTPNYSMMVLTPHSYLRTGFHTSVQP